MRTRTAFTLIELVVVLAILGVLTGLLLPAVQKVRDAASRLKCQNNLHQLGLGAQMYHDAAGSFPAGMRYRGGADPYPLMSWLTALLPYVEQGNLWVQTQDAYRQSPWPLNDPPHFGLATVVPTFACPADARAAGPQFAPRDQIYVALTSYLGVEGRDLFTQDGVLFADSHVRMADVADGTSNTLLAGERPASADLQFGWWYAGAGQRFTGSADMVLGVEEQNVLPYSVAACASGPYAFGPGRLDNQCDLLHFWSLHTGGANFLFVDGSARFLSYTSAPLLPALASRAGGEVVDSPD
jgi:prepilin-type N-terminal cleavage/methylation domain-containing protein/prepilin-type processing-associated H-X9-DG protein